MHVWYLYAGKSETLDQKLKSILAQFEFAYQIQYWEGEGVPFKTHLHVPERHPVTGYLFCEREDEGHVFKVCLCTFDFCVIQCHTCMTYCVASGCI